jgi:hypothetical protein
MSMPGFNAEASLSSLQQSSYRQDESHLNHDQPDIIPQLVRVICADEPLERVCWGIATAAQFGCWPVGWNRDWFQACLYGHMVAGFPGCAACSLYVY